MSGRIVIAGTGAVSSAGWGVPALVSALDRGEAPPVSMLERGEIRTPVRRVPENAAGSPKSARLRRTSPVSKFAAAAAIEAIGSERLAKIASGEWRVGVIYTLLNGCVNYSNRFFGEVLADPSVASPIVFPETVFNAPASHLSAMLGSTSPNDTLLGDGAEFFTGLEVAAEWIARGDVDGCVVVGAEELDWLSAEALRFYSRDSVPSEGAGALYLEAGEGMVSLLHVPDPVPFSAEADRAKAARGLKEKIAAEDEPETLLVDGRCGIGRIDRAEACAWENWTGPRLSPRRVAGEALGASAAFQCVAAVEAIRAGRVDQAIAFALGGNEQAAGARFGK
jgi:3-oxoacyl-(acyl-carrier-protein) synthase